MKTSEIAKRMQPFLLFVKVLLCRNGWGTLGGSTPHLLIWRRLVVVIRALPHYRVITGLLTYFATTELRKTMLVANPCILEQVVRSWFYYQSTLQERVRLIQEHFCFVEVHFAPQALGKIYHGDGFSVWRQESPDGFVEMRLHFHRIHRKEGLLTLSLLLDKRSIYLATFWLAQDDKGRMSLWIGALQGSKGELPAIRSLTKHFFGYRPKNLLMYALQIVSHACKLEQIYAISNHGFQASHHISVKRRLKTSLDEFWLEVGGEAGTDQRFYQLPSCPLRKNLDDVVSHKRSQYRKRYAFLDDFKEEMLRNMNLLGIGCDLKYNCILEERNANTITD